MAWKIELKPSAKKAFAKLDRSVQKILLQFLTQKVLKSKDPRELGKALAYNHQGLWRYRVGNDRIVCQLQDETITILIVKIGHRKNIYNE